MKKHISIIGAGIGGLTTALVLKQMGYSFTVYERASEIKAVGAGIAIANNAMQIYQKMGIHHKIEQAGYKISSLNLSDEKLQPIASMSFDAFEKKYAVYNVTIHRSDLQNILVNEVGLENIQLSKRLVKIEEKDQTNLFFDDHTTIATDIVIGADGIHSEVRKHIFGNSSLRNSNQVCWRGISETQITDQYNHKAIEAWGKGIRFGFAKINAQKTYWYAVVNEHLVPKDAHWKTLFNGFHPDIQEIITDTPEDSIIQNEIIDLNPIKKWHVNNICLIGDAAHATTPNLGQGACQAIEDAYTLGQLLQSNIPLEQVFKTYEKLRVKKAHYIVNTSWTFGKVAHWENKTAIQIRNSIMKKTPKSFMRKTQNKIFDIDYINQ